MRKKQNITTKLETELLGLNMNQMTSVPLVCADYFHGSFQHIQIHTIEIQTSGVKKEIQMWP